MHSVSQSVSRSVSQSFIQSVSRLVSVTLMQGSTFARDLQGSPGIPGLTPGKALLLLVPLQLRSHGWKSALAIHTKDADAQSRAAKTILRTTQYTPYSKLQRDFWWGRCMIPSIMCRYALSKSQKCAFGVQMWIPHGRNDSRAAIQRLAS